jgi:cellulose synthase/poly-beta-1,6-N-acetylglucosamine synthase-like glycosyltransferase
MLFGAYLIETALWILATLIVSIWATRVCAHGLLALRLGKIKKEKKVERKDGTARRDSDQPHVTILLPTYNESEVVDRMLSAVTALDYPAYDIIVADDSTDGLTLDRLRRWEEKGAVRIVHRDQRGGFKAGALNNSLKFVIPESKYLLVLDADCVPPPDILWRMLEGFYRENADVVQGYAELSLNASKNIFTKSMHISTSSYYLVDIASRQHLSGFVPIFGSAFMIKKTLLEKIGGFDESSITEDWALASRLVEDGYNVFFDESIVVPGECPTSFRSLVRQQMRYAEGITRDTKNHIRRLFRSRKVTRLKKFDYIFYGFSPINSLFGLIAIALSAVAAAISGGLLSGLGVDRGLILGLGLPGQVVLSVVPIYLPLTFMFASFVALYREDKLHDFPWSVSSLALNFAFIPFIVFSSFRGMLVKKGRWARTPKTGEILP